MKTRFILFRRAGVYYCEDTTTGKQSSLRTKDEAEALAILNARNESFRQPVLNLQIARAYLVASDPTYAQRTWQPGSLHSASIWPPFRLCARSVALKLHPAPRQTFNQLA